MKQIDSYMALDILMNNPQGFIERNGKPMKAVYRAIGWGEFDVIDCSRMSAIELLNLLNERLYIKEEFKGENS